MSLQTLSKLPAHQEWMMVHEVVDTDAGVTATMEVLELPHGCLVRSTAVVSNLTGDRIAHTLAFVPHLKVERFKDTVEFKFQH